MPISIQEFSELLSVVGEENKQAYAQGRQDEKVAHDAQFAGGTDQEWYEKGKRDGQAESQRQIAEIEAQLLQVEAQMGGPHYGYEQTLANLQQEKSVLSNAIEMHRRQNEALFAKISGMEADAELGTLVRNMPYDMKLVRRGTIIPNQEKWATFMRADGGDEGEHYPTPEDALKAAGVKVEPILAEIERNWQAKVRTGDVEAQG